MLDRPLFIDFTPEHRKLFFNDATTLSEDAITIYIPCYRNIDGLLALLDSLLKQDCADRINVTILMTADPTSKESGEFWMAYANWWEQKSHVLKHVCAFQLAERASVAQAWNLSLLIHNECRVGMGYGWQTPLIICNDDIVFSKPDDVSRMEAQYDDNDDPPILEFQGHSCFSIRGYGDGIGFFDPTFWPAYYEDIDYSYRQKLLEIPKAERKQESLIHAGSATIHSYPKEQMYELHDQWFIKNRANYILKWGGDMNGGETVKPGKWNLPTRGVPGLEMYHAVSALVNSWFVGNRYNRVEHGFAWLEETLAQICQFLYGDKA